MTTPTIKQVICAVHGGPESRDTVMKAIQVALDSGARLTFFHVMDAEFLGHATVGTLRVVYRELMDMGKFVMLILCDRARNRGVPNVDYILREGNVRKQLHQQAVETGAEVIVMGKPTRSPTKNQFKPGEFEAFVEELERDGKLRVIQVSPSPIADKDLQSGLVV